MSEQEYAEDQAQTPAVAKRAHRAKNVIATPDSQAFDDAVQAAVDARLAAMSANAAGMQSQAAGLVHRPAAFVEPDERARDPGAVNPAAYRFSVTEAAKKQQKYVLSIAPHADPKEPKVVPIRNGDLQLNIIRGRFWIVPEAIVTVLKDAKGDTIDDQGNTVGTFNSYPYQFQKYDGDLPMKSECDQNGDPLDLSPIIYN